MDLPKEKLLGMYKTMVSIREFEQSLSEAVAGGTLPGFVHLGIGQEAVHVGVTAALRPTDWISSTHRDHGMLLARGGDIKRMRAEIFGKATGYCKGKGGSMHLAVFEKGAPGCNGILGPSQTINNGIALALKRRGQGDIAVVVFGDGAAHRGEFHEALNLAACWKLPALAICVNNQYAISVCFDDACSIDDIAARSSGYGIPGLVVDGNDVMAVYEAVSETIKPIRAGKGPALIELKTSRQKGHFEGDPQSYKTPEEVEEIKKHDPITLFGKQLIEQEIATAEALQALGDEARQELQEAIAFTDKSDYPSPEEIYTDLFYEERRAM
ncbi:MAG: thiamine pyrophosphate-dependent dehydrogenase E1 component subunit alpha [Desulfobacterales bacterium]|nr:MAG: thiamine pyrophosphate-dependent dehydrogenase E1 component subunit alpha [Desulfobacterales bacterium]